MTFDPRAIRAMLQPGFACGEHELRDGHTEQFLLTYACGTGNGPDSVVGDAYTDVLLTYVAGMHQYRTALGV